MKIINNLIDIDLKSDNGDHMFVNGITGSVDIIHKEEYDQYLKWKENKSGLYNGNKDLLNSLIKREYIVDDSYNEEAEKEKIIMKYKNAYNSCANECQRVIFILTYGCNFKCPYCYEKNISNTKRMSKEQVNKIFEIYNNNVDKIGLFGGEPLLPGNMEIIKYIIQKSPNSEYSIITNGYYLVEFFDVLKNIEITNIQITLDGEKDLHNKSRYLKNGDGTFDKIMTGIKLYAENKIPIRIRMNVSNENIESCIRLQHEIEHTPWAQAYVKFEMQSLFQEKSKTKNKLKEQLYLESINGHKNEMLDRQGALTNFLFNNTKLHVKIKGCAADYAYRFFDPMGNIYSCILAVGNEGKRVGVYEPVLKWEDKSMLKRDITTIPACRQCKYALICGGGCPNAINDKYDVSTTPNCVTMREEIEEIVPLIYKLRRGRGK